GTPAGPPAGAGASAGIGSDTGSNASEDSDMFPTIVFGDTVIERKEYVAALKAQHGAARLYFRQTYGVDPAEDGWDKAHDGEVPCRWLASRAIDELRRRHAAYLIGVDLGQVADDSYASIVARMEAVNSGNAELKSDGGIVYGRTGFDIDSYLSYELSALKNAYTGDESNPGMSLSDDEVRRYYDEHDWTKDGVDGKAPLDEVRGNVKAQMRSERYDELVSQRAEAIDVTDLPWDALYRFTAGRLG
ncbi:lacto-N-biosidase chaperone LnbY, partial [Bifidobacterium longum]|uniref:lacto-N-biosidase chaperone LnbY n=1 Tax=Bifidobacterium longum TaxID=216816 RepID=UPI0032C1738C